MVLSQNSLGQFQRRPVSPITLGTGWACYPRLAEEGNEALKCLGQADSSKATMKAVQVQQTGGPEMMELVDLPVPQPKSNEAVVKIQAAGVNFIDVYNREGRYKAPLPLVLGQEAAGVVSAIGSDVREVAVGDRWAYTAGLWGYGGYAPVPAHRLV